MTKYRIVKNGNNLYWVERFVCGVEVHPECDPYWAKVYFTPYNTFTSEKEAQKALDYSLRDAQTTVVKEIRT